MTEIKLVFDEPVQRKKAPKHLADLSPADRKIWAKELGLQPFRASQVATHYFSHLSNNPEEWTDIPAAERQSIADALTPKLIQLVAAFKRLQIVTNPPATASWNTRPATCCQLR
jgi:23S rRNA (adenine2503-C2)-methyltransferase